MAISPKRFRPSLDRERLRIQRLDLICQAATYWLLFYGVLELFMGVRISLWLHLRYTVESIPLINSLGLAYILLGLYLRRTLYDPENQYLSVDLLLLYFWVQLSLTLKSALGGLSIFGGEWFIFTLNLFFGVAFLVLRSPSSRVAPEGVGGKDASLAARETIERLRELLERRKRPTQALEEDPSNPQQSLPLRKTVSEAQPHMD